MRDRPHTGQAGERTDPILQPLISQTACQQSACQHAFENDTELVIISSGNTDLYQDNQRTVITTTIFCIKQDGTTQQPASASAAVVEAAVQRQMDDLKKEMRQEIGEVKQMVAKEMADMKGMLAKLVQQQTSA